MKRAILTLLLVVAAIAARAADEQWAAIEYFYGRFVGKRVTLDALVWYDTKGVSGRIVLPSGTSVYVKDPYIERPGGKFPKIEPRLPKGKLVRLVGVLTFEHIPPMPPDVQGYPRGLSYLSLALESFTVVERAELEVPELSPK